MYHQSIDILTILLFEFSILYTKIARRQCNDINYILIPYDVPIIFYLSAVFVYAINYIIFF